jgi:hypothetical protein
MLTTLFIGDYYLVSGVNTLEPGSGTSQRFFHFRLRSLEPKWLGIKTASLRPNWFWIRFFSTLGEKRTGTLQSYTLYIHLPIHTTPIWSHVLPLDPRLVVVRACVAFKKKLL